MIESAPCSGAWNMAVDEVLLQSAIDNDVATLRWYSWREPTVSLGYFQRESDVVGDSRLAGLPRVRRLSGGGTLVHDRELTYSLALPGSQRLIERPVELYRLVHLAFVEVLRGRGADVALRGSTLKRSEEPVLCFKREDEHDLVLKGFKVLGSAQRRRRGAILQHGGLLLGASPVTPELSGIGELCPSADLTALAGALGTALLRDIADSSREEPLTSREMGLASQWASGH
jgi:lipoate-protein ligase A